VVYICFGSLTRFPHEQVAELGTGLADSGVNFVWVVGDKNASASLLPVERQHVTLLASESALRLLQQPISPPNSLARSLARGSAPQEVSEERCEEVDDNGEGPHELAAG
jgi:hypothetical protein